MTLKDKHIILGITGSIAAYKAAYIIRGLVKKGAEVQVVITPAGKEFITPLTLSTLSSHPVISEFFSNRDGTWNSHVDLGLWADAMLIAPATASTIGKMANGIADNMLITTYLSCKSPVFVAPAMDLDMFAHPSTQQNLERLRSFGNRIIEPAEGELASHLVGKGRMEEPDKIIEVLEDFFFAQKDLEKKKILITAGPTYEKIDPVRFIGNYSSGKMGFALAEACAERGDERLRFLGLDGILTATCCPSCVGFLKGPAFNRFALDGGVEVFPSELFDGTEKTDCYVSPEEYKALTENPFVLGEAPVPLFYGAACQDVNTIGGFANWVQDAEYTTCPHCGKPMKYLAQIQWDTVFDCAEGTLYVEFCSDCQIVSMQHQQT